MSIFRLALFDEPICTSHEQDAERLTMTTAWNLWLGFGTLTALLVLVCVAIRVRVRNIVGFALILLIDGAIMLTEPLPGEQSP